MKQRPKAPWYISSIDPDDELFDRFFGQLGCCQGCTHIRVDGPTLPDGKFGITVTCAHPERQGPGLGLSTNKKCPHHQVLLDASKGLENLAFETPLRACPICHGTGGWVSISATGTKLCSYCWGTGAVLPK